MMMTVNALPDPALENLAIHDPLPSTRTYDQKPQKKIRLKPHDIYVNRKRKLQWGIIIASRMPNYSGICLSHTQPFLNPVHYV